VLRLIEDYSEYTPSIFEYSATGAGSSNKCRRSIIMKRTWACPNCLLVFSRKWNFHRHLKLMHGANQHVERLYGTPLQGNLTNEATHVNPRSNSPFFGLREIYEDMTKIADMQNKISNSPGALEYQNSLQWQINSLRQQVASYENRISGMVSYNWLFPRGAIQGISGYLCRKCQTFSLKMIIDLGYDMTMEAKHRCIDSADKRSYTVLAIPSDNPNVDDWAARRLMDHLNYYLPMGKYLIAIDIAKLFEHYGMNFSPEGVRQMFGIPDRWCCYSVENNCNISWINQAVGNLGKVIAMTEDETLDFFKKVKSTYAIFEVPIGETVRQFFMTFTNYYESQQYYSDLQTIQRITQTYKQLK
jgi:hypothetical protein